LKEGAPAALEVPKKKTGQKRDRDPTGPAQIAADINLEVILTNQNITGIKTMAVETHPSPARRALQQKGKSNVLTTLINILNRA
jgi:hypothetical protein